VQNYNSKFKTDIRQRCYQFSLQILQLTDTLPNKRSAWVLSDQLIRSATSVGANLVEGRAASSRLEFKKFYEIALKSANETQYWLNLIMDARLSLDNSISALLKESEEISCILASGVLKLKERKF